MSDGAVDLVRAREMARSARLALDALTSRLREVKEAVSEVQTRNDGVIAYISAEFPEEQEVRDRAASALGSERLSKVETEVLRMIASGSPNDEIARQLGLTPEQVKHQVRTLLSKLSQEAQVGALGRLDPSVEASQGEENR